MTAAARLRPTRRLWGMAAAAAVVYLFATNSEVVWLYLIAGMLLALLPIGVLGPVLAARRLRVEVGERRVDGFTPPLRQDRGALFAGDRIELRLRTTQGSLLGCAVVAVHLAGGGRLAAKLDPDGSGTAGWLRLDLPRRGLFQARAVELAVDWPLGLLTVTRRLPLHVDLLALPRYWLPPSGETAEAAQGGENPGRRGLGEDFIGLREYHPGDAQRRIHWPTSARSGTLMVVETAAPSISPAGYALTLEPDAAEAAQDLAVAVAASLVAGSVAAGQPFAAAVAGAGVSRAWRETMARLAVAGPGAPARRSPAGREVEVVADAAGVRVSRGEGAALRLPGEAGLDEARVALVALWSAPAVTPAPPAVAVTAPAGAAPAAAAPAVVGPVP